MGEIININVFQDLLTNAGTVLLLIIAYKSGLLKYVVNGKLWNGQKTVEGKIDELRDNHFHELKDELKEIRTTLNEFREYGIRIRKDN